MKSLPVFILSFIIFSCTPGDQPADPVYIGSDENKALGLPFGKAVIYDGIIYVSGQEGELESGELIPGGIIPETSQTLKNIQKILEENGSSMDQVIKCTCMLADISEWEQMSAEYVKFFPNHLPARSAFATTGLSLNARVEIECMAAINK